MKIVGFFVVKVKINQKSIDNKKSHRLKWLSCLSKFSSPTYGETIHVNRRFIIYTK